jgi:tetratricopeptide (TPR) repeat protein
LYLWGLEGALTVFSIPVLLAGAVLAGQDVAAPSRQQQALHTLLTAANPLIVEGDAHYRRRQEGRVGSRASSEEISKAVAAYEKAGEARGSAEARWKLARALYFEATYTGLDAATRRGRLEKARRVSEEAIAILAERAQGLGKKRFRDLAPREMAAAIHRDPDAPPSFFWASVAWGEWALAVGKWKAARTGAAKTIRDYAATLVALDPEFEEGGGYRILGRLHDEAPRIPLVTGWVSRKEALRNLRLAVRVNPRNFVNRLFLAEALSKGGPAERGEAVRIARALIEEAPSPIHLVEELKIQEDARRDLKRWNS